MNRRWSLLIVTLCFIGFGLLAHQAKSQAPNEVLAAIKLPANSCAISCPQAAAQQPLEVAVTCISESRPVCQCQDTTRPFARCEAIQGSN